METKTAKLLRKERMETPFNILIEMFASTKQTKGRSPCTVTWYRERIGDCAAFLGNGSAKLEHVNIVSVRSFITELQSRNYHYRNLPEQHTIPAVLSTQTTHGLFGVYSVLLAAL